MAVFKHDIIPDVDEENKIVLPKNARNATVPHIYNSDRDQKGHVIGYQRIHPNPEEAEFPRVMYRKATKQEIEDRKLDLPEEMWMDKEFDLVQLTGRNHLKRHSTWIAWMERPIEILVLTREEFDTLAGNWFGSPDLKTNPISERKAIV